MSKTNHKLMSFVEMWYKVNELSRKGYSQSQISLALCVNRATVRRYQSISEADFNDFLHKEAQRHGCKLDAYRDFIIQELRDAPFLSSMQVLDQSLLRGPQFISICNKNRGRMPSSSLCSYWHALTYNLKKMIDFKHNFLYVVKMSGYC